MGKSVEATGQGFGVEAIADEAPKGTDAVLGQPRTLVGAWASGLRRWRKANTRARSEEKSKGFEQEMSWRTAPPPVEFDKFFDKDFDKKDAAEGFGMVRTDKDKFVPLRRVTGKMSVGWAVAAARMSRVGCQGADH